ncbi:MAG: alpha-amylase family glycosyl hydrolase [Chitinophagales bacterium]
MRNFLCLLLCSILANVSAQNTNDAGPWYHHTTVYQVYPRSYYDSNGDGIGDIQGIIQKLDYIKELGFETIWCSPFFKGPQKDFGYDIADYTDIAPEYGTVADAEQLINEVHKRGMRVVFDMVMNHTSDEHPWFKESAASKDNAKADWYIWRDKPNGWRSSLKMKGWHYSPQRKQYYWASFLSFQPDLNYRKPEVKKAMFECVKFWLEKGVDGYRLDMFNSIYKDEEFRSNAASRKAASEKYNTKEYKGEIKAIMNQPESFGFAKELRSVCDTFGDKMLLGEVFGNNAMIKRFLGEKKNDGLGLAFTFDKMLRFKFKASYFHKLISSLEQDFGNPYMPVYVFSNHDRRRSLKRLNGDVEKAKLLHFMQLTVRGVPCMYYGEEIGMTDARMPYKKALDPIPHLFKAVPRFLVDMAGETLNRDELRTPMQWNEEKNAGFSKAATTWLPVHENYTRVNVKAVKSDKGSLYNSIKEVLAIRNSNTALTNGEMELINRKRLPKDVLGYIRVAAGQKLLVLLNFGKKRQHLNGFTEYKTILLQMGEVEQDENGIQLPPLSAVILKL